MEEVRGREVVVESNLHILCRKIFPIHEKFCIVAVGEATPTQPNDWLTPELLSMFQFIHVTSLPKEEEKKLIQIKVMYTTLHVHMYYYNLLRNLLYHLM